MESANQNIHILFPKEDLKILQRRSCAEKKSVATLIREAVRKVYGRVEPGERREAFSRLCRHSELEMDDWEKVKQDLLRRYG